MNIRLLQAVVLLAAVLFALPGCAPSATVVSSSGGPTIQQAQQEPYAGVKKRIAVKAFEFKAAGGGSGEVGRGMSDMLANSLFNTNRFIVK
jgi:curli biogenesis system outer membrane secretion channel CsgG